MLSPRGGGAVSPVGGGVEPPGAEAERSLRRGAACGEEKPRESGVQEWPDGSRYEGEFMSGLKHGRGKYTWSNGECYEGSFYKDYKHGDGTYSWPSGLKFTGKFYLNRKEGWGCQEFLDGTTFQGLYHADQRFGPGAISYPDGCNDVGLWLGERLIKFCTSVEEGFSLKNFPEYSAYMDSVATSPPTQGDVNRDLLSDDFILPPGIESYSTDGDHLPLPPSRRRELDQHFYGQICEPDSDPYRGYERDPVAALPLESRLQAHIQKYRQQVDSVDLDTAAVLSLNRERFGPKGPLEVRSELLIQHASRGELQAVSQILRTSSVHPDVADSQGHTALIAATVNCHNHVIQLLLDAGANIDKLNGEGMSALAVCHVLYYPFWSLQTPFHESPAKTQVPGFRYPFPRGNTFQISQVDFTADSPRLDDRPPTTNTTLSSQTNLGYLSDLTTEEELVYMTQSFPHLREPETKSGNEVLQEEKMGEEGQRENKEEDVEKGLCHIDEEDMKGKGSEEFLASGCYIRVSDGPIVLGSVQWKDRGAKAAGRVQDQDKELTSPKTTFDSTCSFSSYDIPVTEEMMQRSAEALSHAGIWHGSETQETVRKMAAIKIQHRAHLKTLKLLLERGADPDASRVPMHVLFLAVMAADVEGVRRLLLSGAHTDIPLPPEKNGLYPLHVAAALPGPAGPCITELLLHTITDPDARASDQSQIYEPDKTQKLLSNNETAHLKEGGRTALHMACQRDGDRENASKVVTLLLSHRASTDLLWSGHSPLSLAIAVGNDLAVRELLNGGANPNAPLDCRVGSALCAVANINYNSGNKAKLLEMLVQAGADILMPVMVGDAIGTAVDYAHHSFNQDLRIANTPFHALSMQERETFKARRQLLSMMGDLLRQSAGQRKQDDLEKEQQSEDAIHSNMRLHSCGGRPSIAGKHREPEFKFCYQCGRSLSVKLSACSRCHQVFFCSRACKLEAWDERHKEECSRMIGYADAIQKSVAFKCQKGSQPLAAALKSKTLPGPLNIKIKSQTVTEPLRMAEKILVNNNNNLQENYSCN